MGTITTIQGTAYWAQVQTASKFDTFSIVVGNLDEETVKTLAKSMISHRLMSGPDKKGEDYGTNWVRLNRKSDDGKPVIVGPDGITPFDGMIGNGSKIRVQFESWVSKNNYPNGHKFTGVQILELVPFGTDSKVSFDDASGEYETLPDTGVMSEVVFGDEQETEQK